MREPWDDDPDNLSEMDFSHRLDVAPGAANAVAKALGEINTGHDAKRKDRAARIRAAFREFGAIELIVSEFLTGVATNSNSVTSIREARADVEELVQRIGDLQQRLDTAGNVLRMSVANDAGEQVMNAVLIASAYTSEALEALLNVGDTLAAGEGHFPAVVRGRGGALGRMRLSPDVVLLMKLEQLWQIEGLRVSTGVSGDGLDIFLSHALNADSKTRTSGSDWIGKLREKRTRETSTEIHP